MSSRFCPSILLNFHRLTITDAMFKQFSQNLTIHAHYCLILNKIKHTNTKLCCIGHLGAFWKKDSHIWRKKKQNCWKFDFEKVCGSAKHPFPYQNTQQIWNFGHSIFQCSFVFPFFAPNLMLLKVGVSILIQKFSTQF